jgi:hypothetical protein
MFNKKIGSFILGFISYFVLSIILDLFGVNTVIIKVIIITVIILAAYIILELRKRK